MKKTLSFTISAMLVSVMMVGCSGNTTPTETEASAKPTHQVYLDVKFKSNLMADKYDVDVFLGDEEVGSIAQGDSFTKLLETTEGDHELTFYKKDDKKVRGTTTISLTADTTFKCTIKAQGSRVEIDEIELVAGTESPSSSTKNDEVPAPVTGDENPFKIVENMEISFRSDYAHIDREIIRLGTKETASISITASPAGLSLEDFTFVPQDKSLLKISFDDPVSNVDSNKTEITAHVTGVQKKKSASTELYIVSSHDLFENKEDSPGFNISVRVYNAKEGRVVYITPTGKKYHYSAEHAGENSNATTMAYVQAYEIEPCGTCVE